MESSGIAWDTSRPAGKQTTSGREAYHAKTFCVAGTDARQRAAARALRDAGYTVLGPGQAGVARYALLPMPLDTLTPEVSDVLGALPAGALALGERWAQRCAGRHSRPALN